MLNPTPPTNLPGDLNRAIEQLCGDTDYAIYTLDGQEATLTGGPDDWHDALVLIDDHSMDTAAQTGTPLPSPLIKLTRDPEGVITYYYPLRRDGALYTMETTPVAKPTTEGL